MPRTARPLEERFWEKVDRRGDDECWPWLASLKQGRPQFSIRRGVVRYGARVAYALTYGEIPAGAEIHHKCRNPVCVNPAHLEALSPSEHDDRHRVLECPRGHSNWSARHQCRVCDRDRKRRARRARAQPPEAPQGLRGPLTLA